MALLNRLLSDTRGCLGNPLFPIYWLSCLFYISPSPPPYFVFMALFPPTLRVSIGYISPFSYYSGQIVSILRPLSFSFTLFHYLLIFTYFSPPFLTPLSPPVLYVENEITIIQPTKLNCNKSLYGV